MLLTRTTYSCCNLLVALEVQFAAFFVIPTACPPQGPLLTWGRYSTQGTRFLPQKNVPYSHFWHEENVAVHQTAILSYTARHSISIDSL